MIVALLYDHGCVLFGGSVLVYIITRTSECVITLRIREISLPKTMNMISTDDHHELVFMPYNHRLDDNFNGLCV